MNPTSNKVANPMPDNKGTTYSFDVCSQCKTSCCQDAKPPLTAKRKTIIQEYLKNNSIKIDMPFAEERYCYPSVDKQVYCRLFNKKTGKCMVHIVKPETCVAGPITFDIDLSTRKVQWFLKKNEICAYAGILYDNSTAFKEHFEVAKKQLRQLISQLSLNELRVIVAIPEPLTLKIGEEDLVPEIAKKLGLK